MDATLKHYLDAVLPYRLYAISTFNAALKFVREFPEGGIYECSVGGKVKIQGKSTAITNPSIEMGLVHSRVLLEFLGLKAKSHLRLNDTFRSRSSDINIENYGLDRVTIEKAVKPYDGDKNRAERAFAETITAANKLVAHSTEIIQMEPEAVDSFVLTSIAIPVMFDIYFYKPLGVPMPDIEVRVLKKTPNKSLHPNANASAE